MSIAASCTRMVTALVLTLAAPMAGAGLIGNPGFESGSLLGYVTVLTDYNGQKGKWGVEVGSIVGTTAGVAPAAGTGMLALENDGLSATQVFQVVDMAGYAASIDSGRAEYRLSAWYNSADGVFGRAVAGLWFFVAGQWEGGPANGKKYNAATLDGNRQTWQEIAIEGTLPANTRWLVVELAFENAGIGVNAGFLDEVALTVSAAPAPTTLSMLLLGGLLALRRGCPRGPVARRG